MATAHVAMVTKSRLKPTDPEVWDYKLAPRTERSRRSASTMLCAIITRSRSLLTPLSPSSGERLARRQHTRGQRTMHDVIKGAVRNIEARGAACKEASEHLEGVEQLIAAVCDSRAVLGTGASLVLLNGFKEAVQTAKRACQYANWGSRDVADLVARLGTEQENREASFKRLAAYVNWAVDQGYDETNPTNVMAGLHESCPEDAKPTEASDGPS